VLYEEDPGRIRVAAIDPLETVAARGEPPLQEIAREVRAKLERAISRVGERL
jgi:endonuclease YncB( thermonuclease family)